MTYGAVARALRRWRRAIFKRKSGSGPRYDRETIEVMRRVLSSDSSCVDVGAHRGDILDRMVLLAPGGGHHAFEALPHLAASLRRRFPDVSVHEVAVSDRVGEADFVLVENDPGYSGLRRRQYDHPRPRLSSVRVRTGTLDAALPADAQIRFIKMDIEGGEYHALLGCVETIRRCRPVIVFEAGRKSTGEYGVTPERMYALLSEELGYEVSTMRRWLDGSAPLTPEVFAENWDVGPNYYFIAVPRTDVVPADHNA